MPLLADVLLYAGLTFLGLLGALIGLIIFSLLSLAQKGDAHLERMPGLGEEKYPGSFPEQARVRKASLFHHDPGATDAKAVKPDCLPN